MRKLLLLTAVLLLVGCTVSEEKTDYLTVSEVWDDARALEGKQIRVRGWSLFMVSQTLMACQPVSCDCNTSRGEMDLLEKPGYSSDALRISVSHASHGCRGNECYLTCTGFDPASAEEFELVGTLRLECRDDQINQLILEDVDVEASRQLVAGEWIPIPQGQSVHRFEDRIEEIRSMSTPTPFIVTVVVPRSD